MQKEYFTSRWGLIYAALGMAIGTGNVWRFPRIAAKNGGGAFIIAWIISLFLWSIPILIIEFGMGKKTRKGVIGAFGKIVGKRYVWMGSFVVFCTMAIMYYYSVVMGWCLKYFIASFSNTVLASSTSEYWNNFTSGFQPVLFHFMSIIIVSIIVYLGVIRGIEKANRLLIPTLFILLFVLAVRAVFLPGAEKGLNFLFNPEWGKLFHYQIWLEALTQSAWSNGAGWGLLLTYSIYIKKKEDIVLNSFLTGFGNNSASLISAIAVLCTIFAVLPEYEALKAVSSDNTGLTFVWIPMLFERIPGGILFMAIFFLGLTLAALSSLIAMVELAVRIFIDLGLERHKAIYIVAFLAFFLGIPSAVSMGFLNNQDWTWSLGLMINGFFMAFAVIKYGTENFRNNIINTEGNDINLGKWFDIVVKYVIPVEFFSLIGWWFYQSITIFDKNGWWNPLHIYSIGTCLFQWGFVIFVFIILNRWIADKSSLKLNIEK